MDLLCAYHAKSEDMCRWVIANCDESVTDNLTVNSWLAACKAHLQSLSDGPVLDFDKATSIDTDSTAMRKP
jgi:hypothetical protein